VEESMTCRISKLIKDPLETLEDSISVQDAAAFMARRDLGSVLVSSDGRVIGLFTEKDMIKRVIGPGNNPKTLTLGEVCTRNLISIHEDASCETAVKTMRSNRCRRLLVYRGDTLRGLVTLPKIAQAMAEKHGRKNTLLNIVGGITLMATLAVIGLWIYQFPEMLRIASAVMK
jgi:signal-transduction protein with cAMP-binding, CBS, and nucleotidyltransferase domain